MYDTETLKLHIEMLLDSGQINMDEIIVMLAKIIEER